MNMYEAIFVRKSVKKFILEEIESSLLKKLTQFAQEVPLIFEHAKVEFSIIKTIGNEKHTSNIFTVNAPYYFMIACDENPDALMNAGYLAEQITLYLIARGFGTCCLTYGEIKQSDKNELSRKPIIAVGFGKKKENMYSDTRKLHRFPEKDMTIYKSEVSNDVQLMIKAARLAPSYLSNPPCRFVVYDNRIHIFCKKKFFLAHTFNQKKYLDIGIMLANILLVAEELWIDISVEKVENISNKPFKNNEYIVSVLIK